MSHSNSTASQTPNLNALVGSRICHDLINPLGAIGNGIELLGLAGVGSGPEMDLVSDAVASATAKLKFLRLAFGSASADQVCGPADVLATLEAVARGGRMSYAWDVPGEVPRRDVRVAMLAVMCIETALPAGGDITIRMTAQTWEVYAKHDRLNLDPALWVPLSKTDCPDDLAAAQVHFGLLPAMAAEAGRGLSLAHGADWVRVSF